MIYNQQEMTRARAARTRIAQMYGEVGRKMQALAKKGYLLVASYNTRIGSYGPTSTVKFLKEQKITVYSDTYSQGYGTTKDFMIKLEDLKLIQGDDHTVWCIIHGYAIRK